jgi:hypothetical protein
MKSALLLLVAAVLALPALAGSKSYSNLRFTIIKDSNGKPVRNASVVLHPVGKNGHQDKGGLELKTDPEGKTGMDGVPYGKLRVQVIAPGYRTYGQDVEINQPDQEITIKLQRPSDQYSIYTDQHSPPPQPQDPPK